MDSRTHVEFAVRLAGATGEISATSLASLFPQIDRRPPTLHRLYAHTCFKARRLAERGRLVLTHGDPPRGDERDAFEVQRFEAERDRILEWGTTAGVPTDELADATPLGLVQAYVSHLYLDSFNQPTQAFAPDSVACCGQWALWEELGDFRFELYTTSAIDELRGAFASHSLWDEFTSTTSALTQAMVHRLATFARPHVSDDVVARAVASLALERVDAGELAEAIGFLAALERTLYELHREALGAGSGTAPSRSAVRVAADTR